MKNVLLKLPMFPKMTIYALPGILVLLFSSCQVEPAQVEDFSPTLETHIRTLSSDAFEGRAPATAGGRKTVDYLETAFREAGLQPAVNGSFRQAVPLVEITGYNFSPMFIRGEQTEHAYSYRSQVVVGSPLLQAEISLDGSEMVFVGYGIVAPEYGWNDYEGVDVSGKTVVILVNDPGYATQDPELFTGNAMTYYGRWTYKYEEAARQGAAAALIVHEDGPAGYGWDVVRNSWTGPQYDLDLQNGENRLLVEGWLHQEVAREVFKNAGTTLTDAMDRAARPGFSAEPMDLYASIDFQNRYEQKDCYNVAGYIEGSRYPDEVFIYMGHWDHLGKEETEDGEVLIYNGAIDNATGTAGLIAMAERFVALEERPERSVLFIAVTAEESGLIGSRYYSENPLFPIATTVGGINMDGLNVYGPTSDLEVVGLGFSELDDYLGRHAAEFDRYLKREPEPEKGYYFRSDHFNLARVGVPMIFANGGSDFVGRDEAYAEQVRQDMEKRYHQPTDVVHDMWDFSGIHQDLWLFFNIGLELANSRDFPNWSEDSEFRAIRDATISNP
jgi:Zn-dependent M28 family amino/carboxypeptidase